MLKRDDVLERVRRADPLLGRTLDADPDEAAILGRVLAQPRSPNRRSRSQLRLRAVLAVAILAAALLVPAAVAFREVLGVFQATSATPSIVDLEGRWATQVSGLTPAGLNGRWTLRLDWYRDRPQFFGAYSRSHNGKVVATGSFSFYVSSIGPLLALYEQGGPRPCAEIPIGGVYAVRIERKQLILEPGPAKDVCRDRRVVMLSRPFHR